MVRVQLIFLEVSGADVSAESWTWAADALLPYQNAHDVINSFPAASSLNERGGN